MTMAASVMEQRRLGLMTKAMLVVPGRCLAQAARKVLALHWTACILVADEINFTLAKQHRFLGRSATVTWDAIVVTHSAFRFIETKKPYRTLMLASDTLITNALGEMFSVQCYLGYTALTERGLQEFDAWASTFGDITTELELQPNCKYKPVTCFATFVNVR